jgi:hypothetical protein
MSFESDHPKIVNAALLVMIAVMVAFILNFFLYFDYLHDQDRVEKCTAEFGDGSSWIGNGWADDSDEDIILCETSDGEIHKTPHSGFKPMNLNTLTDYVNTWPV